MDINGTIQEGNETMAVRFGTTCDELIGHNAFHLVPPDLAERRRSFLERAILSGKPIHFEDFRNGRYIDNTIYPVFGAQGSVDRVAILGIDITERKRKEESFRTREARYKRLVENSPNILYSCSENRGLLYLSSRAESVLGSPPLTFLSEPFFGRTSIHPDDAEKVRLAFEDCKQGKDLNVEYRMRHCDGQWIWLHDRSIGQQTQKEEIIIEGLASDITLRRQNEKALQEWASFAQRHPFQRQTADKLCRLLENLLRWSRMQRGMLEYAPQQLSLYYLAAWTMKLFLQQTEQKHVELHNTIPEGLEVFADLK